MSASREFIDYVLEQLHELGNVRSKRMFGGAGLYCDEVFFAIIESDTLRFKVDETNREDYAQFGMAPFKPYAEKNTLMQYYEVPAHVLEDEQALVLWARRAIDVAIRAKK